MKKKYKRNVALSINKIAEFLNRGKKICDYFWINVGIEHKCKDLSIRPSFPPS